MVSSRRESQFQICTRTPKSHSLKRTPPMFHLPYLFFQWSLCCFSANSYGTIVFTEWIVLWYRIKEMHSHFNERSGLSAPLVADDVFEIILKVTVVTLEKFYGLCSFQVI